MMENIQAIRSHIRSSFHSLVATAYLVLLIIGIFFSLVLPENVKEHQKSTIYLLNSKNLFNTTFAYKGNLVWTILFIYLTFIQIYIRSQNFELLPTTNARNDTQVLSFDNPNVVKYTKQYIIKYVAKNFILFCCFVVIDNIFIITGGQCSSGDENMGLRSAEACRKTGGEWVGGFDISGHFCFLLNISLILWCELYIYYSYIKSNSIETFMDWKIKCGIFSALGTLMIWVILLFVTAIYYHTLLEKIFGCIMGDSCFYVMYEFIPNNTILNKYLY